MNPHRWILPVVLGLSLASIYVLPSVGDVAESAVNMELPGQAEDWVLQSIPPSEAEIGTLAKDTEFSKAVCLRPRPGEISDDGRWIPDRVDFSIVLSGHDLNNSIHRPERCMPAQGHNILSSSDVEMTASNGREFTVKRLRSVQTIPTSPDLSERIQMDCVTYYFFVGHDRITHDHLNRTLLDMKDRLLRGMDQRWAYASASMWFGKVPWIENEVTEEEADRKLMEFVREIADKQIAWDRIRP
jgi:hypothetical protein